MAAAEAVVLAGLVPIMEPVRLPALAVLVFSGLKQALPTTGLVAAVALGRVLVR